MDITNIEYLEEFEDVLRLCLSSDKIELNNSNDGINVSTVNNNQQNTGNQADPLLCTKSNNENNKEALEEPVFIEQNVTKAQNKRTDEKIKYEPDFIDCGAFCQTEAQSEPICTFSPEKISHVNISPNISSTEDQIEQQNKKIKLIQNQSSDFIHTTSKNFKNESKNKEKVNNNNKIPNNQREKNNFQKTTFVHDKEKNNIRKLKVLLKRISLNKIQKINKQGVGTIKEKCKPNSNKNKRKRNENKFSVKKEKTKNNSNSQITKLNKNISMISKRKKTQVTKIKNDKTVKLKKQFKNEVQGVLDEMPIEQPLINKLPVKSNVMRNQSINSIIFKGKNIEIPQYVFVETKFLTSKEYENTIKIKMFETNTETVPLDENNQIIIKRQPENISKTNKNAMNNNLESILNNIDMILNKEILEQLKANNLKNVEGFSTYNTTTIIMSKRNREAVLQKFNANALTDVLDFLKTYLPFENARDKDVDEMVQNLITKIDKDLAKKMHTSNRNIKNNLNLTPCVKGGTPSPESFDFCKIDLPVPVVTTKNPNIQTTKTFYSTDTAKNNQNLNSTSSLVERCRKFNVTTGE